MRKIGSANLIMFFLFIAALIASSGFAAAPGQENIPTIQNSAEPKYATPTITLTEVWEVGGENPGFIINNPVGLDVDAAGRIYILDILETDVKVFAADGQYLYKFGQKGQGPGDLHVPYSLTVLPDQNQMIITDFTGQRRFNFFDIQGQFLHSFRDTLLNRNTGSAENTIEALSARPRIVYSTSFDTHAFLLLTQNLERIKYQVRELWWYDYDAMNASKIVTLKRPSPIFLNDKETYEQLEGEPQYCAGGTGDIYFLRDIYDYNIEVYDSSGSLQRIIRREFTLPPKSRTEYQDDQKRHQREIQQYKAMDVDIQIKTLRHRSIIYGPHTITRSLFIDGQHRLWVLTNEPYPPHKSRSLVDQVLGLFRHEANASREPHTRFSFDVFNPQGRYLMKIPFDANQPRCFRYKDGYLYFVALKEDGFPWLCKYRIVG